MHAPAFRVVVAAMGMVTIVATTTLAQATPPSTPAGARATIALKWGPATAGPNTNMFFSNSLPSIRYTSDQAPGRVSVLVSITTPVDRVGEVDCFISLKNRSGVIAPQLLSMGPGAALGNAETGKAPVYSVDAVPVTIAIYALSRTASGETKRAQLLSNVLKGTLHRNNDYLYFFSQHPQRTESLSFDPPQ